jgi:hypothetical protein
MMRALAAAVVTFVMATPAFALNQARHEQISHDSCVSAGLPEDFCERVGAAAHNVDNHEFDDLPAHAQMPEGWTACDAANASGRRVSDLGAEVHDRIFNQAYTPSAANADALADALGRALHTLQDDCAHAGMPNPQHAWSSLRDVCEHTQESPDVQPEAIACAQASTDEAIAAVLDVMTDNGVQKAQLASADEQAPLITGWFDACAFLASVHRWDGVDRRWDNGIVDPWLRRTFASAVRAWTQPPLGDVCADAQDGILVALSPDTDVTDPPDCAAISVFCGGKADDGALPPYQVEPAAAPASCTVAVGGRASGAGALLLLLFVLLRRTR